MGPRGQRHNRSKVANKAKHNKSLKNKLRDVQRLLKKSDLPATVRVVQERMLEVLKESIKDKAREEKEKQIVKRSKKVKFFEKRKLLRRYKACVKELKECKEDEKRDALEKELEEIKLQWNYVSHFPQDTRYISLFPLTSCTDEEVRQKQEHILNVISEKVASGELEDASTTILQMSSGSKERKPSKLRLADDGVQVKQKEGRNDESEDDGPPPKLNLDDDFFIDSIPISEPPTVEEKSREKTKKKKTTIKRKRSQFKFKKD